MLGLVLLGLLLGPGSLLVDAATSRTTAPSTGRTTSPSDTRRTTSLSTASNMIDMPMTSSCLYHNVANEGRIDHSSSSEI
jgi:hypothetical protein